VGLLKGLKTLVVEWHLCGTSLGQEDKMTDVLANPPTLTDDQFQAIEDELVSLAVHINRATYRMLCLIRELDICGAPQNAGFCSTAHYLSWRLGFDMVTAREKVRVARALTDLPAVSVALEKGRISYAKVRAITRIATPETEAALLNIAENGTATHVDQVVRRFRRADSAEQDLNEKHSEGRYLHTYHDDDGMLVIEARLAPEEGAVFMKALEAAQELEWKKGADAPAGASLSPGQKRADALGTLARAALAGGISAATPASGATPVDSSRYEVVVHVDAEVLADPDAPGRCEIEDGSKIPAGALRRITCDSAIVTMTHGKDGQVLDVGRKYAA
jgi:hypothetical protein